MRIYVKETELFFKGAAVKAKSRAKRAKASNIKKGKNSKGNCYSRREESKLV